MAEWKKVVVSGSSADLLNISASGNILPKSDNQNWYNNKEYKKLDLTIFKYY